MLKFESYLGVILILHQNIRLQLLSGAPLTLQYSIGLDSPLFTQVERSYQNNILLFFYWTAACKGIASRSVCCYGMCVYFVVVQKWIDITHNTHILWRNCTVRLRVLFVFFCLVPFRKYECLYRGRAVHFVRVLFHLYFFVVGLDNIVNK